MSRQINTTIKNELVKYNKYLGENPDPALYAKFINENTSIEEIQKFFNEKIKDLIFNTYNKYLSRDPDDNEYKTIYDQIINFKISKYNLPAAIMQLNHRKSINLIKNYAIPQRIPNKIETSNIKINNMVDKNYAIPQRIPNKIGTDNTIIKINNMVDKIYVIDPNNIRDRLKNLKIEYEEFTSSKYPNIFENASKEYMQLVKRGSRIPNIDKYNNLLAHLEIIKNAKQQKLNKILILEDNILFHNNFEQELQKINQIPDDWQILYFGALQKEYTVNKLLINRNNNYYKALFSYGSFAYIIKSSFYDTSISILETKMASTDHLFVELQKKYNFYVVWENLIIQNLMGKNIINMGKDIPINWQNSDMMKILGWDISKYNTPIIGSGIINNVEIPKSNPSIIEQNNIDVQKRNILLVVDVNNWCFANIAKIIKQYFGNKYNIYIEACMEDPSYAAYKNIKIDLIIKFWYGYDKIDPFEIFPAAKKAICVYDYIHWNKDINQNENRVVKNFSKNIVKADYILYACPIIETLLMKHYPKDLENKQKYPVFDGVDINKFYYKQYNQNNKLIVGWTGNMFNVYKRFSVLKNIVENVGWIEFRVQDRKNFIPHDKMVEFYHNIDVIICLSDAEGTPNPILEASASGRTWISTDVGIVRLLYDTIDGPTKPGIIINNYDELLPKLKFLYENKNIMAEMGRLARQGVEKSFSWDKQVQQFGKIFGLL